MQMGDLPLFFWTGESPLSLRGEGRSLSTSLLQDTLYVKRGPGPGENIGRGAEGNGKDAREDKNHETAERGCPAAWKSCLAPGG